MLRFCGLFVFGLPILWWFLGGLVIGSCLGIDLVWFLTVAVGFCRLRWFGWRIVWFRYIVGGSLC